MSDCEHSRLKSGLVAFDETQARGKSPFQAERTNGRTPEKALRNDRIREHERNKTGEGSSGKKVPMTSDRRATGGKVTDKVWRYRRRRMEMPSSSLREQAVDSSLPSTSLWKLSMGGAHSSVDPRPARA